MKTKKEVKTVKKTKRARKAKAVYGVYADSVTIRLYGAVDQVQDGDTVFTVQTKRLGTVARKTVVELSTAKKRVPKRCAEPAPKKAVKKSESSLIG